MGEWGILNAGYKESEVGDFGFYFFVSPKSGDFASRGD